MKCIYKKLNGKIYRILTINLITKKLLTKLIKFNFNQKFNKKSPIKKLTFQHPKTNHKIQQIFYHNLDYNNKSKNAHCNKSNSHENHCESKNTKMTLKDHYTDNY